MSAPFVLLRIVKKALTDTHPRHPNSTEKVRSAKQQYYQNVALKVNVKLNGINQVVKQGVNPEFAKMATMVFGAE